MVYAIGHAWLAALFMSRAFCRKHTVVSCLVFGTDGAGKERKKMLYYGTNDIICCMCLRMDGILISHGNATQQHAATQTASSGEENSRLVPDDTLNSILSC